MKLRTALILLLLLGTCVLIPVAHSRIAASTDQVEIYETVLEGDPAVAETLLLSLRLSMSDTVIWDVGYRMDGETEVDFRFHHRPARPETRYDHITSWYEVTLSGSKERSTNQDLFSGYNATEYLAEAGQDVASRTSPGQRHSELIRLRDYYEYYPLDMDYYIYPYTFKNETDMAQRQALADFFRIPVPEHQTMTMTIEKDLAGQVFSMEYHVPGENRILSLDGMELPGADYVYLLLCQQTEQAFDYSHIPGGFGIYRAPIVTLDNRNYNEPDFTALEMAFSLPEKAVVEWFSESYDDSKLYLITKEEKGRMFTVIDLAGMTRLQRLSLEEAGAAPVINDVLVYEDGVMLRLDHEEFLYLHMDETGAFSMVMRAELPPQALGVAFHNPAVAWDGKRLAVLTVTPDEPQLFLMVYEADQRQYLSYFETSLTHIPRTGAQVTLNETQDDCAKRYEPSYRVSWLEEG